MKHQRQHILETKNQLEFTPLEFETRTNLAQEIVKGKLEFTPLEFETMPYFLGLWRTERLEFTPLEFETDHKPNKYREKIIIRIYSVGV